MWLIVSPRIARPFLDRVAATPAELDAMRAIVRQGMEEGAFGLSSGLSYVAGMFTSTAEVVELANVAGRMGGIYISHMRDEASAVRESVHETIEVGEKGGLRVSSLWSSTGRWPWRTAR